MHGQLHTGDGDSAPHVHLIGAVQRKSLGLILLAQIVAEEMLGALDLDAQIILVLQGDELDLRRNGRSLFQLVPEHDSIGADKVSRPPPGLGEDLIDPVHRKGVDPVIVEGVQILHSKTGPVADDKAAFPQMGVPDLRHIPPVGGVTEMLQNKILRVQLFQKTNL